MADLPHPWGDYARLQDELAHSPQVSGRSWGLEAALNRLVAEPQQVLSSEDADRAVRTESRKERHRAALRRAWMPTEVPIQDPEGALEARRALRLVKGHVSAQDWALLHAVGEGYQYGEIATLTNTPAGALRVRVLRLRRALEAMVG